MEAIGLLVTLEARSGKEADAEAFLKSAQPLALNESKWAVRPPSLDRIPCLGQGSSAFSTPLQMSGEIAKALGARANELLAVPPQIEKVEVIASTPLKG